MCNFQYFRLLFILQLSLEVVIGAFPILLF